MKLANYVLDYGLSKLDLADELHICSAEPTDFANVASVDVGLKDSTPGNIFGTLADNTTPPGRKLALNAISDGIATASATASYWAAVDSLNARLLATGALDIAKAILNGQAFTLNAFVITYQFGFYWWLNGAAVDLDFRNGRYYSSGIAGTDPNKANTVLMLHGDGVDGSINISDSTGRHFVTPNGSAQIDTAQSKFGGASILTAGGADCLSLDGSSDFVFSTGDFTIDFWLRPSALSGYLFLYSGCGYFDGTGNGIDLFIDDTTDKIIFRRFPTDTAQITSTTALSINTLYHVALTRASGQTRLFINGTQEGGTFTDSTNYIVGVGNVLNRPVIGKAGYGEDFPLSGWIDEFRVLKGVAAWTANFTPPTAPYDVGIGPYDQLSITRASIGYAQTVAGTLTQFAANQLRITDQGLLIEDARTNSVTRSQNFNHADWPASGLTSVTDNAVVAPDGTTTGATVLINASLIQHNVYNTSTIASGFVTWSCYFKAGTSNFGVLCSVDAGNNRYGVVVNLSTGAVTDTHSTGTPTSPSSAVQALGNGWWRVSITAGGGSSYIQVGMSNSATPTWNANNMPEYTGNGTDTISVWGAQVEAGAFASSYIPTTSAAATRAAETILVINAFDTIMNGSEGSVFANAQKNSDAAADASRILGNNTGGNRAALYAPFTNNQVGIFNPDFAATINAVGTIGSSLTWQTGAKGATSWGAAGASAVGGGGTVGTDVDGPYPFANTRVGAGNAGTAFWNGYIRRLTAWNTKLADATLRLLTFATPPNWVLADARVDLDFVNARYFTQREDGRPLDVLSITRASIGYAQTVAGTLTQFAANQLRITDQGLLIEDARTNEVVQSVPANFGTDWFLNNTTQTPASGIAPDGTTTAVLVQDNATNGFHYIYGQFAPAFTNGVTYTVSAYVKAGTANFANVFSQTNGNFHWIYAQINLTTGAISASGGTGSDWIFVSAGSEALGNGWFRVWATGTATTTTTQRQNVALGNTGTTSLDSYVGGSGTIYVWGAQLEIGAFPSSYIPTTTALATRAADAVTCLATLSALNASAQASLVGDVKTIAAVPDPYWRIVGGSAGAGYPGMGFKTNTICFAYDGATLLEPTIGGGATAATGAKVGMAWDGTGRSAVGGGGTILSDANDNPIPADSFLGSGNTPLYGYMRRLTAWDTRLADAKLQALTVP